MAEPSSLEGKLDAICEAVEGLRKDLLTPDAIPRRRDACEWRLIRALHKVRQPRVHSPPPRSESSERQVGPADANGRLRTVLSHQDVAAALTACLS